jgi:hypothetical protein
MGPLMAMEKDIVKSFMKNRSGTDRKGRKTLPQGRLCRNSPFPFDKLRANGESKGSGRTAKYVIYNLA